MRKTLVSFIAIIANLFLAIGKVIIGFISNSAAIIADGINSSTDVIASTIGYIGIKKAKKPADKEHPYGHERAEVLSGFIITIIILLSGLFIIYDAIKGFFSPSELELSYLAFGVMAFSALTNGIMSYIKIKTGKKYDSVSLVSDGVHSRIDLLVSLGIFLGLFLARFYSEFDSIIALLVGLYILKESIELGKETTDSLLGAAASQEIENKIKEIVKKNKIEIENLKTQKLGSKVFAELTIKLPSKTSVDKATSITKKLEKELIIQIRELEYVSIQIISHDIQRGYHRATLGFGKGYGWQKRGLMKKEDGLGEGPGGYCVCPKCKYKVKHERGVPCSDLKCPNHNLSLIRDKNKGEKNAKTKKM